MSRPSDGVTDTRTLKSMFNQVAEWYPEHTAFVQAFKDRAPTYAEANEEIRRIANALADAGVDPGDRVAMLASPTVDHAFVFFACQKLGAISSTVHARESPNTIRDLVEELDPAAVVYEHGFEEIVEPLAGDDSDIRAFVEFDHDGEPAPFASMLGDLTADVDATEPDVAVSPTDPAFINFSSGTTGRPKGIVHTHEGAVELCHGAQYTLGPHDDDTIINASTPSFIAWKNLTLPLVNVGGTTVFLDEWDPDRVPGLIDSEDVTISLLVPTQWKMVAQGGLDSQKFASVRLAGYAGGPLGPELFRTLRDTVTENVFTVYGTTEITHSGIALRPHRVTEDTLESIGRPVPNVDVRLIDPGSADPTAEVADGEVGELVVRGPSVSEDVWRDPERTAENFHEDGWWFSGDLAQVGEDGNVYIKGRTDNMIISGDINIYPEGIEGVLEGHPDVVECAIIGVPDEQWNEIVKAYVVRSSSSLSEGDLAEWCEDNDDIASYERPREWEFVDSLPRTNTGKLNRAVLREEEQDAD